MDETMSTCSLEHELPLALCPYCNVPVMERISIEKTRGLKFYKCPVVQEDGSQCSFSKWLGRYAIWLIRSGVVVKAPSAAALACFTELKTTIIEKDDKMEKLLSGMWQALRPMFSDRLIVPNRSGTDQDD